MSLLATIYDEPSTGRPSPPFEALDLTTMRARSILVTIIAASLLATSGGTALAKSSNQIVPGGLLARGVDAWSTVGWEIGRRIAVREGNPDPGNYPGFRKAVVDPVTGKLCQ